MSHYEDITRLWLETRYRLTDGNGVYLPHEPIYGPGIAPSEPGHVRRLLRIHDLLSVVSRTRAASVLDVGASEGYFAALCRDILGLDVQAADVSVEACKRATEIFGLPAVSANAGRLPFRDGAFDVVVLAETFEHLNHPVHAILEARRVASKRIILSTEEWCEQGETRLHVLNARRLDHHMQRNVLSPPDLYPLFDPLRVQISTQRNPADRAWLSDFRLKMDELATLMSFDRGRGFDSGGVIVVADKERQREDPFVLDQRLVSRILDFHVSPHQIGALERPVSESSSAVCPRCRGNLTRTREAARCEGCGSEFAASGGVLDLHVPIEAVSTDGFRQLLSSQGGEFYPGQAADLASLDRLWQIEAAPPISFAFKGPADFEPWTLYNLEIEGGTRLWGTDFDPQFVSPWLGLELKDLEEVQVTYGAKLARPTEGGTEPGELFFWFDGAIGFTQELSLSFPVTCDGVIRTHRVPIPLQWRKSFRFLVKLRLDFLPTFCEVDVRSIRIVRGTDASQAETGR